jgi:hypothetical protein
MRAGKAVSAAVAKRGAVLGQIETAEPATSRASNRPTRRAVRFPAGSLVWSAHVQALAHLDVVLAGQ